MPQDEPGVEAPYHQAANDVRIRVQGYLEAWKVHTTMTDVDKVICALQYALQEISEESSINSEELMTALCGGISAPSSLTISPPSGGHSFVHPAFESILGDFQRELTK